MSEDVKNAVEGLRKRILGGAFNEQPYPHLIVDSALDQQFYQKLVAEFPASEIVYQGAEPGNNYGHLLCAADARENASLGSLWRETVAELATPAFFGDTLTAVSPHARRVLADIETRLGKPLEDCSMSLRGTGEKTDLYFDVQIGVNSPVSEISRVREVHVDKRTKIFNALLYMRDPQDVVEGGNLAVYEWKGSRRYLDDGVTVSDDDVNEVAQVEYTANRLFMFLNSPDSLHGVTPRLVTPLTRRYINVLLVAGVHLFETNGAGLKRKSSIRGLGKKLLDRLAATN